MREYDDLAAKGIPFQAQEGEVSSLLGPNGAGKTTTSAVLSTVYAAIAGASPAIPSRIVASFRALA